MPEKPDGDMQDLMQCVFYVVGGVSHIKAFLMRKVALYLFAENDISFQSSYIAFILPIFFQESAVKQKFHFVHKHFNIQIEYGVGF